MNEQTITILKICKTCKWCFRYEDGHYYCCYNPPVPSLQSNYPPYNYPIVFENLTCHNWENNNTVRTVVKE